MQFDEIFSNLRKLAHNQLESNLIIAHVGKVCEYAGPHEQFVKSDANILHEEPTSRFPLTLESRTHINSRWKSMRHLRTSKQTVKRRAMPAYKHCWRLHYTYREDHEMEWNRVDVAYGNKHHGRGYQDPRNPANMKPILEHSRLRIYHELWTDAPMSLWNRLKSTPD